MNHEETFPEHQIREAIRTYYRMTSKGRIEIKAIVDEVIDEIVEETAAKVYGGTK